MKKLALTLAIYLGCMGILEAQNVWKPINIPGTFKGVAANGDLFIGETGIQRSQDEGETWQIVLEGTSYNAFDGFTISPDGRIFDLPYNQNHLCISDDGGDTWRNSPDFLYTSLENALMYAVSDDTLFLYQAEGDTLHWTLDGGNTWDKTCLSFLDHDPNYMGPWFGTMLADEAGNVYIGTWSWYSPESGVFQANLDNMDEWSLIISDSYVQNMAIDLEGNVVINCSSIANNGVFFSNQRVDDDHRVLTYSLDHGETYKPIGENLPSTMTVPDTDLRLLKGNDQHLYCHGDVWSGGHSTTQYYKSVQRADEISIPLNGIVTRVPAPYFESNASDIRLAIVSGEETYYTTVDGYWPNPDGDALIVDFDTIPIGSEIEVGGTCSIMEDENGNIFKVFDIKRLTQPVYTSALGYLQKSAIALESSQFIYAWSIYDQKQPNTNPMTYFVTINGEIQTELPVLNGMQLNDSIRCTFVGIPGIILDYFGNSQNVLELTNVISYEPNFTVSGFLSTQGDLCLATPCGETPYLSLEEGDARHYLTLVDKLQHNYINDIFFNEGVTAEIHGIEATHYDLFGAPFHTLDILEMETSVEKTLVGPMVSVPNPCIGFEWPLGMEFAFYHHGIEYYTPNVLEWYYPMGMNYLMCYIVDSDTLFAGKEVTANLTSTTMRIDNYLKPRYWATLNHAEYYDHLETLRGRLAIAEEPYNMPVYAFVTNDNTTYLIEPYFLTYAEDDHIVINHDTLFVGDSFTATGEVFNWYDNSYEYFNFNGIHILEISDIVEPFPLGSEWYYEIENENGSITYQYMYQAGDTVVGNEPTHILVKINTLYDKDVHTDVTHEYVYERNGKLYWWNKTLEEFTILYDFGAEAGDEWEIKVGTESLVMHVDAVEEIEFGGRTYRMLRVSDPDDLFSGDIVCGIGHLTSFFPERLMDNGDGIRVDGLRCYWIEDELVFKIGDEDCDAIYEELHGIEDGPSTPSTGSGTAGTLMVYPNPTNGVLFVETRFIASQPTEYRITNLMGQTVLSGNINADNQQINVSSLPQGMYFITFAGETRKFVVR